MNLFNSNSFVDAFVKERFEQSGLQRDHIFSHIPLNFTAEELKIKTNLVGIAQFQTNERILIESYPKGFLENVLIMEQPKKIVSYYNPATATASKEVIKRQRNPKGSGKSAKSNKRNMPEMATIYSSNNSPEEYNFNKKSRSSSQFEYQEDSYESATQVEIIRGPPPNLYPLLEEIMNYFWNLDYEPDVVSFAFFANINAKNCQEFKLQQFSEESCSMAIIKVSFCLLLNIFRRFSFFVYRKDYVKNIINQPMNL